MIDSIYLKIIKHLYDGRKKFSLIAEDLGVSENTVRSRVNRLIDAGLLRIVGLINPEVLPGHYNAFIGFKTDPKRVQEIAKNISNTRGVISSSCVSGQFDIICFALFNDDYTMNDFLYEELNKIDGINAVEPFQVLKGFNSRCIYVL